MLSGVADKRLAPFGEVSSPKIEMADRTAN
jgi:hypothetical protein